MVTVDLPGGDITVTYRLRETGLYGEAPFVDEWKPLPPRLHAMATMTRHIPAHRFGIGVSEVTAEDFHRFLATTGYQPPRTERFAIATGGSATYVDLADARAYAAWVGFRLPTEDEWQIAAEVWPARAGRAAGLEPHRKRARRRAGPLPHPQRRLRAACLAV